MATCYQWIESPIGKLLLAADDAGLSRVGFAEAQPNPAWTLGGEALREAAAQLGAYFAGDLQRFELKLNPAGTPFQLRVWEALRDIPYGETISYGELARRIGNPSASRAVGLANGANPIAVVVPCHRVIGSNGKLTGYGGGLDRKRRLLDLECAHAARYAEACGFQLSPPPL
jgi:methylated-DNA-[protein]-cysteine S-methyltransferase